MKVLRKPDTKTIIKINKYIKNKIDISELICNIDIKGLNLSNSIINNFNRYKQDISNINLTNAKIGKANLSKCIIRNACFKNTFFSGKTMMRYSDVRGTDFSFALAPKLCYQYTDFRGCNLCGVVIPIGTRAGIGAKFDMYFFKDLAEGWNVEIIPRKE